VSRAGSAVPASRYQLVQVKSSRTANPNKFESKVWKGAQPYRDGLRKSGDEIWDWENTHNDIEVYDGRGRHQGSRDPTTGNMYKPAVPVGG
jgi:Cytotoxic